MLLTLKPFSQNVIKGPHDYAVTQQSIPTPRSSPPSVLDLAAVTQPSHTSLKDHSMESSHSGLPPPSSLALPPPDVGFATMNTMNQQLPPPPPQRHGSDHSWHSWIESKTEEDRRKQEEEKTRQESLRLEQRKIEQSMLRDSLQAGVPPHMVPLIFAGISQGGVPQSVLELTQQYMAQATSGSRGSATPMQNPSHSHSHSQRRVPHVRRDSRSIPPNPYAAQSAPQTVPGPGVLLSQPIHPSAASPTTHSLSRHPLPSNSADPRPPGGPRPNPGDGPAQTPSINLSNVQYAPGSSVPSAQHTSGRHENQTRQSPPSLYFHHWTPPSQSNPNTPLGRPQQELPSTSQAPRRSEYQSPPGRKRKALGPHPPAPLPSSRPSESLSISSQTLRPQSPQQLEASAHHRRRSDMGPIYESSGPEPVTSGPTRATFRSLPPTEDSNSEKGYGRPDYPVIGRDRSISDTNMRFSHPPSRALYASSIETAPRDSDVDSSPGPSPTSRTQSTQPGVDVPAAGPPLGER
ncbi:hypothetical protein FE257_012472 [Aspergillus nanangensis]|uniref:Uncharacterized protein n=1 Tax=Aspergillus nanangensis TaxID=2582783 RepID=A0AAD4CV07_ASPNN|nr:hypothetical protein FE257_012472 [Aspergillus nanangensis]